MTIFDEITIHKFYFSCVCINVFKICLLQVSQLKKLVTMHPSYSKQEKISRQKISLFPCESKWNVNKPKLRYLDHHNSLHTHSSCQQHHPQQDHSPLPCSTTYPCSQPKNIFFSIFFNIKREKKIPWIGIKWSLKFLNQIQKDVLKTP